jgi:hypothetical protein
MVYGTPPKNLGQENSTFIQNKAGSGLYMIADVTISNIVFVSPYHLQAAVTGHTKSTFAGNDVINIRLSITTSHGGIKSVGYNVVSNQEQRINIVLDAVLSARPDYIVVDADVTCFNASAAVGDAIQELTQTIHFTHIDSDSIICKVGDTVNMNTEPDTYNPRQIAHICLPAAPIAGEMHRIKNANNVWAYVHTLGKPIDNGMSNTALYYTSTIYDTQEIPLFSRNYVSSPITVGGYGFIMPPLHACMLMYDGTKWLIQEYFDGARVNPLYMWWNTSLTNTFSDIIKPLVICDIGTGNKYVRLPSPSSPIKFIRIIVYSSNNNMATNALFIIPPTGIKMEDEQGGYNSFYLRANANNANACISFISDGAKWWVQNVHVGTNITYQISTTSRPQSSKPITILSSSYDGITLPLIEPTHPSKDMYVKMPITGNYNGVVAQTPSGTFMVSSPNNTAYSVTSGNKYTHTAASVVAINPSLVYTSPSNTAPIYFITGYYFGYITA